MAVYFSNGNLAAHFRYPLNNEPESAALKARDWASNGRNWASCRGSQRACSRRRENVATDAQRSINMQVTHGEHAFIRQKKLANGLSLPKYAYKRYFAWLRADIPNFD